MAKSSSAPTNEMRQGAGAVGLAISKTRSRRDDQTAPASNQRRPDGKPKLSINTSTIANNVSGSNQTIRPVPATQRGEEEESPMTEFEEDGGDISPKQIWHCYVNSRVHSIKPVSPSKTLTPASVYASEGGPWNRTPTQTPPVPSNSLVPKPLSTRQPSRNYRAGPDLGPWAPPAPVLPTAYSPVLNPFLDTNDVSPVRRAGNSTYDLTGRIPAPQGQNLFRPSRIGQTTAPSPTPMPGLRRGATSSNPQLMATPIVAPASRAFVQPYSASSITPTTNRYSYIGDPSSPQQTSGAARSTLLEKRLGPDRPSQLSNLTVTPVTSRPSVQSDMSQPGPWRRMMRDAEGGASGATCQARQLGGPSLHPSVGEMPYT
ncbi:unnamed protein product [Parascedosporium putredinis]|uniref:Uncharacterized protein n=1 Tax=Parascedosporium putredinis TaxID=1442378 RepID=A0A9P1H4M9_9PEZI|nr:unnamed protein product [Parascedosporium putredinis]CAI7995699.1 unnamed protein product [Parascedosporium putredinis]